MLHLNLPEHKPHLMPSSTQANLQEIVPTVEGRNPLPLDDYFVIVGALHAYATVLSELIGDVLKIPNWCLNGH